MQGQHRCAYRTGTGEVVKLRNPSDYFFTSRKLPARTIPGLS